MNLRRRSRFPFGQVALLALSNAALVFLLVRHLSGAPADIRAGEWESLLGLPNERGDCLDRVQYGDVGGDGSEEALVLVRTGCGDAGRTASLYGIVNGQVRSLWGTPEEPALFIGAGDAAIAEDGSIKVRDADPDSPLNRSGLLSVPQLDRHTVFRVMDSSTGSGYQFGIQERWHDPVLLAEVHGTGGCLNVRGAASTSAAVVGCLHDGGVLKLAEGPETSGGITWWSRAGGGWLAGQYLKLFSGPDPGRAPPPG